MRANSLILFFAAALQVSSTRAEVPEDDVQAGKIHQAFEAAQKAHKKQPLNIEKEMADESTVGESFSSRRQLDLNPADRRGPTPSPVQSAQDAVSRPAPQ